MPTARMYPVKTHTLVNLGFFQQSFHRRHEIDLEGKTWNAKGQVTSVDKPDLGKFDGILFGYMDGSHETFLVRVGQVWLREPVLLVPGRHGVKGPGPSFARLNDDAATNILVDLLVANPELRDILGRELRTLEAP